MALDDISVDRDLKKKLKRELKARRRILKLRTSIRQATQRRDHDYAEKRRVELENYLSQLHKDGMEDVIDLELTSYASDIVTNDSVYVDSISSPLSCRAKAFIINIRDEVLRECDCNPKDTATNKRARDLLGHMTKGSQTIDMFQDEKALIGYSHQKFLSRAMLLFESLEKLNTSTCISEHQHDIFRLAYERIRRVKRVFSIGCGPGNDLVGLISFLKFHFEISLEKAYLLDWAVDQWSTLLTPLKEKLRKFCCEINIDSCDITQSLFSQSNDQLLKFCNDSKDDVEIICLSYVLTEQREKWHEFLLELIEKSSKNAIFYFAEPITWQLFCVISLLKEKIADRVGICFLWIDSSCFLKHLQKIEGRNGPAVLLILKGGR